MRPPGKVTLTTTESATVVALYASTLNEAVEPAVKPVIVAEVVDAETLPKSVDCDPLT